MRGIADSQRWRRAVMLGADLVRLASARSAVKKLQYLQRISQSVELLEEPAIRDLARQFLSHAYAPLRGEMCYLLGQSGNPGYLNLLGQLKTDEDSWVRQQAQEAIRRLTFVGQRAPRANSRHAGLNGRKAEHDERVRVCRVLIASPSNVKEERKAICDVLDEWNAAHGRRLKIMLQAVRWETHCFPAQGDRPQEIVNRQIVDGCDVLVGVFSTRLGTPTGVAESGTAEEIERLEKRGKPVILYFSACPVSLDMIDPIEYQRLSDFKTRRLSKGLVGTYKSISELREQLLHHISCVINSLQGANSAT